MRGHEDEALKLKQHLHPAAAAKSQNINHMCFLTRATEPSLNKNPSYSPSWCPPCEGLQQLVSMQLMIAVCVKF